MPTTRILVRRDLAQSLIRLERIQTYLARSGLLYEQNHTKEYEMFCVLMVIAEQLKEGLTALRSHL